MTTDEAAPYEGTPTSAFGDLARRLVGYHPPVDEEVAQRLGEIRNAYADMISRIEFLLPDATPETTLAARAIHDACQRCISAVIHNQQVPTPAWEFPDSDS